MRAVLFYSSMGGNMRCRKDSTCSTRAKGSMYPRLARLRLRAAALHSAPLREPFLPLLAPLHAGRRSMLANARASGG